MALVDILLLGLTVLALPWAIIELGLSAYLVNIADSDFFYDGGAFSSRVDFLLFASLWTILVVVLLLVFPFVLGRGGSTPGWAAPFTIGINTLTMIFWLAGFAAFADLGRGGTFIGVAGATLAFAVMLWLIFLALTVLSILTAMNVVRSERFGYGSVTRKTTVP